MQSQKVYNSIREVYDELKPETLYITFKNIDEDKFLMKIFYDKDGTYQLLQKIEMKKELLHKLYKGEKYNKYYGARKYEKEGRGFKPLKDEYGKYIEEQLESGKYIKFLIYNIKLIPYTYKLPDTNRVYYLMEIDNNGFDDIINNLKCIQNETTNKINCQLDKRYLLYKYLKRTQKEHINYTTRTSFGFRINVIDIFYYLTYDIKLIKNKEDLINFNAVNKKEVVNKNIIYNIILYHILLKENIIDIDKQEIIKEYSINYYYKLIYKEIERFNQRIYEESILFNKLEELTEYIYETMKNDNEDYYIEKMKHEEYYSIVLYKEFSNIINFYYNEINELLEIYGIIDNY